MENIVTMQIEIKREPKYPLYAFGMWMRFDNQNAYLDWQNSLGKAK